MRRLTLIACGALLSWAGVASADHYSRSWIAKGSFFCQRPARPAADAIVGARVEFYQAANTTIDKLYTSFRDNASKVGVNVPGHDPLDHLIASTHTDQFGAWSFSLHAEGNTGDPPFYARLVLDDDQGVNLTPWYSNDSWSVETNRAGNNGVVVDYGATTIFSGGGTPQCAVWQGARNAYQDYVTHIGSKPPSPTHHINYGLPVPTPFTLIGTTVWPDGYPTGKDPTIDDGYATDYHEFGHDIRHTLDGSLTTLFANIARYHYAQRHDACKHTNPGFAFNEGWAEFWAASYAPAPCQFDNYDLSQEGNVADLLTSLTKGSPICAPLSRAQLVHVLAVNPGQIYSWESFLSHARALYPCNILLRTGADFMLPGYPHAHPGRVAANPLDLGEEYVAPFAQRRGRVLGRIAAAARLTSQLGRLAALRQSVKCPPLCTTALGDALAPAVVSAMSAELRSVMAEYRHYQSSAGINGLAGLESSRAAVARLQADAAAFNRTRTRQEVASLTSALAIGRRVAGKPGGATLAGNIAALGTTLAGARHGALTGFISGLDADLHRNSVPAILPSAAGPPTTTSTQTPPQPGQQATTLSLNCPQTATAGQGLTITGQLSPALAGATVEMSALGPGSVPSQMTLTDQTGTAYYSFAIGGAGTWVISGQYAGDSTHAGSAATCTIVVSAPTSMAVSCPTGAAANPFAISGLLSPAFGGASITITYTPTAAGFHPVSHIVTTDPSGAFADASPPEDGGDTVGVTAVYNGDAGHSGSMAACSVQVASI